MLRKDFVHLPLKLQSPQQPRNHYWMLLGKEEAQVIYEDRSSCQLPVCKTEQNRGDDILSSNEIGNSSFSLSIPISNENGTCTSPAGSTLSRPSIIASVWRNMDPIRQGLIKYIQ